MRHVRLSRSILTVVTIALRATSAFGQLPLFAPTTSAVEGESGNLPRFESVIASSLKIQDAAVNTLTPPDPRVNQALRTAVRDARDHPNALYDAWRVARDYPATAIAALRAQEQSYVTLALARVATDSALRASLIKLAADTSSARTDLDFLADALRGATNKYGGMPALTVFAFGDIRGAVTGPDPKPGVGTGALGLTIQNSRAIWQALINVAATSDTLRSAFGLAVLSPTGGKPLSSGSLSFRTSAPLSGGRSGPHLHVYGSLAHYTWRDSTLVGGVPTISAFDASVFGTGVLLWHELGCCHVGTNAISLSAEYGVSLRWLDGDVGSSEDFRTRTLGTGETVFPGIEAGTQLAFGRVIGTLQGYYLVPHKSPNYVSGLTRLQVLASFSIAGDVFSGVIDR